MDATHDYEEAVLACPALAEEDGNARAEVRTDDRISRGQAAASRPMPCRRAYAATRGSMSSVAGRSK